MRTLVEELEHRGVPGARLSALTDSESVDTQILEAELLSEAAVIDALSEVYNLAGARIALFHAPPDLGALRAFPEQWALKHCVAPVSFDRRRRRMVMLCRAPPPTEKMADLAALLEIEIELHIAPEVRVWERLWSLYDLPEDDRFAALRSKLNSVEAPVKLADAQSRDELIAMALSQVRRDFEFVAFLGLQGRALVGWDARGAGAEHISSVSFDVGDTGQIAGAVNAGGNHIGHLMEVDRLALAPLNRPKTAWAILAPLALRGRCFGVIYADNGTVPFSNEAAQELLHFASSVEAAMAPIVVKRKASRVPEAAPVSKLPSFGPQGPESPLKPSPLRGTEVGLLATTLKPVGGEATGHGDEAPLGFTAEDPRKMDSDHWESSAPAPAGAPGLSSPQPPNPEHSEPEAVGPEDAELVYERLARATKSESGTDDEGADDEPAEEGPEVRSAAPEPAPGPSLETWIAQLGDASKAETAKQHLVAAGEESVALLQAHFPGPLTVDPFGDPSRPAFGACGPLLSVIEALGEVAEPAVRSHLDNRLPASRYFATDYYGLVRRAETIPKLLRRLHDEEPKISELAASILREYRELPDFDQVRDHLRARLNSSAKMTKLRAIELLSRIHDRKMIPALVALVEAPDRVVAQAALSALQGITLQDLPANVKKWKTWWADHGHEPRVGWLVSGLGARNAELRVSAIEGLRAETGMEFGYEPNGERREREESRKRWQRWWEQESEPPSEE